LDSSKDKNDGRGPGKKKKKTENRLSSRFRPQPPLRIGQERSRKGPRREEGETLLPGVKKTEVKEGTCGITTRREYKNTPGREKKKRGYFTQG